MSELIILDIWSPDEKYANHRIPGILITSLGTIIIYNEARREANDWSLMDIFAQRSVDGGESFGAPIVLAEGTVEHKTVNNPVMMQDKNGRIHLLFCEDYTINGGRALHRYSDDDGISWSEAEDITASTDPEYHNAFAFGPGHGICTPAGDLVVPVWMVPKYYESPLMSHMPSVMGTFYSLDCGKSWRLGEILPLSVDLFSPNETALTLLEDGTVYLNCRLGGGLRYRGRAYSKTGYSNWYGYEPDKSLHDPSCFGSVASIRAEGKPFTVLFANCENKGVRANVTVKGSVDSGKTWTLRREIDAERGGYVEMNVDPVSNKIYVLYESAWGTNCHLAILDYDALLPI